MKGKFWRNCKDIAYLMLWVGVPIAFVAVLWVGFVRLTSMAWGCP